MDVSSRVNPLSSDLARVGATLTPPEPDQFSRQLLAAMLAFREGDFGVRLPADLVGLHGKIADAFNDIVAVSERRARETARARRCDAADRDG